MSDSIFYLQHIEDCRDRSTIALQFTFNPVVLKSVKANYLKQLLDDDLTRHFTLVSEEKGLFSAVNCSTVVFLRILSCLRGRNFDIITSNAYLDIYTNCIIKTFYFESSSRPIVQQVNSDQDIGRKTSSNIPNSNANSTVNESSPVPSNHRLPPPPAPPAISNRPPPPDVKSASVTSPISQKESAVDMSENDDVAIPSFVGSDKNENISMTPPIARSFGKIQGNSTNERNEEYFKRMKEVGSLFDMKYICLILFNRVSWLRNKKKWKI